MGAKAMSFVAGPIAALVLAAGLVVTAFGLGAGSGLDAPLFVTGAIVGFLNITIFGAILGGAIGLGTGLILRLLPGRAKSGWGHIANMPIRIFGRRTSTAAPRTPAARRARRELWIGIVTGSLAIAWSIAFGIGVDLRIKVNRRLAAAAAAAARDDPHWQIDDLMAHRERVPDDENSALVVAAALRELPDNWPLAPSSSTGARSKTRNRADILLERLNETESNARLDPPSAEPLRQEMEQDAEAVRLARGVAEYARGRHELILGPKLIDTLLPETQGARNAARLLALDVALRAHDGDLDGGLDSCRAILGVARSIGDEPFLISQIVRIAVSFEATKSARRVLGQGEPSDDALSLLQSQLLDDATQPLMLRGMRGERATLTEMFRRMRDGAFSNNTKSDWDASLRSRDGSPRVAPWTMLWYDLQRAVGLELMNHMVATARQPAPEWPARANAWEAEFRRLEHERTEMMKPTLLLSLVPAVTTALTSGARYQAELNALAILLAAERHRRKWGEWPKAIAAIDPEILANPPIDPWTSQPFRMERQDGRIVIYAIGPNGRDDHGVFDRKTWARGGPDDVGSEAWDVPHRRSGHH